MQFWGIYFGLAAIATGVLLVLFRLGIFSDHANEMALGVFVFVGGYAAVLTGCWWWLKAKGLNEALVLIGMMPLVILFVPYVRLIFVAAPAILPVSMVMMPIILIVVVFVLPDQSGTSRRRHSSHGMQNRSRWVESIGAGTHARGSKPPAEPTSAVADRQDGVKAGHGTGNGRGSDL